MAAEDSETSEAPVSTGRDLAARALVAGATCTQQRAADLLETSRRSVGRREGVQGAIRSWIDPPKVDQLFKR